MLNRIDHGDPVSEASGFQPISKVTNRCASIDKFQKAKIDKNDSAGPVEQRQKEPPVAGRLKQYHFVSFDRQNQLAITP
jgi:hypothetical protein